MFLSLIVTNVLLIIIIKVYSKLTCGICKSSKHLVGKVVIVTGGNTGIGYETAKNLAERGAKVIIACRDQSRGTAARDCIASETGNDDVHFRMLDLASLRSVREFADNIIKTEKRLDVLINNAGAISLGNKKTEDGLLVGMQVNHFAPFLLTNLLLPLLKASAPSRIINVSSGIYTRGEFDINNLNMEKETESTFSEIKVYANSKLFNILMTVELNNQLKETGVTANALHPGAVKTDILKNVSNRFYYYGLLILMKTFYKSSWEGAQTTIYLAASPEVHGVSGCYFSDCRKKNISRMAQDPELARKLWVESERLVKLNKQN